MNMPAPYWLMTYSADRRKHRHRCRHCKRIVKPGEDVYMARIARGRTQVLHAERCASETTPDNVTQLDLLECHGMSYLASLGFRDAQSWLDASPLTKARNGYGELA